jgi:hypothetical protein
MSDNDKVVSIEGRERQPRPPLISAQEVEKLLSDIGRMSPVEYGQKRFTIAERVGVSLSLLDLEYRDRRKSAKDTEAADVDFLRDVEPWPTHWWGSPANRNRGCRRKAPGVA